MIEIPRRLYMIAFAERNNIDIKLRVYNKYGLGYTSNQAPVGACDIWILPRHVKQEFKYQVYLGYKEQEFIKLARYLNRQIKGGLLHYEIYEILFRKGRIYRGAKYTQSFKFKIID